MTSATVDDRRVTARFAAPWDAEGHSLFIRAKRLPEASYQFDRDSDSYTVSAPARFAPLLGLTPPPIQAAPVPLLPALFDYQRWIVERALEAQRFAVWADCGLGKTPMGLEWARQVRARTGGRVLIICPKMLIPQWCDEARKFYGDTWQPAVLEKRTDVQSWCMASGMVPGESPGRAIEGSPHETPLAITNFEKFIPGVIDEVRQCAAVVLDESSILKGGGGVIKWNLIKSCRGIEYKLSLTATPAPNDTMEYASQASWLEKLRNEGEILWTYFYRGSDNEWHVRPHAREAFYKFMSSWSVYLRKPSAYGFEDRFDLPEPELIEHRMAMTDAQAKEYRKWAHGQGQLIGEDKLGVTARNKLSQIAKGFLYRDGKAAHRIHSLKPNIVADLVRAAVEEDRHPLVWTVFDEESEIIMERLADLDGVASLHGKDKEADRLQKLEAYRHGELKGLVSKAKLLGWGLNFPFCSRMIFSGFNDSFESFYQAVRRAHRYGATERLQVHVPFIPELEMHMWNNLLRKRAQWEADVAEQERRYVEAMKVKDLIEELKRFDPDDKVAIEVFVAVRSRCNRCGNDMGFLVERVTNDPEVARENGFGVVVRV